METCAACEKGVYPLEMVKACNKSWHKLCFRCKDCNMVLSLKGFAAINDEPYCKPHYMKLFHSKGNYAGFGDENAKSGSTYTGAAFMGMSQVATLSASKSPAASPVTRPKASDSPPVPEPATSTPTTPPPVATEAPQEKSEEKPAPVTAAPEATPVAAPEEKPVPVVVHDAATNGHAAKPAEQPSAPSSPSVQSLLRAAEAASSPSVNSAPRSPTLSASGTLSKSGISRPPPCAICLKGVYPLEQIQACNKVYHKLCFKCKECHMVLSLKAFATINDEPYCKPHYMKLFHSKGNYAGFSDENAKSGSTYTGAAFMGMSQVAALSTSQIARSTPPGSPAQPPHQT